MLGSLLLLAAGGCDHQGRRTRDPGAALVAAGWIDDETVGQATLADPDRLAALGDAGISGRVIRLDRLLDLYDAARFADDGEARDSLWAALGDYSSTRGIDASREVVLRLLDEAYAIDDRSDALSDDERRFVADAIMLLSADMFLPDSAEALITQTLAYRSLVEDGHPRIADNAHWRLYDHVRGVLVGAVEIGPELRADILVHALYAEREDISPWLEELAPHAQPPLPSPTQLWALLEEQRAALEQVPRWQAVVASRSAAEADLHETVTSLLPRPRDPGWVLPQLTRGTAQRESLAPVLLARPGELVLEPTAENPRTMSAASPDRDALTGALEALLARDGRGLLLFAADPKLPAPEYARALQALASARTGVIELAVHEPRIGDAADGSAGDFAVLALPLHVARADDRGPGARALRQARIHVQLDGRGPRFRVDGRWLSATAALPSDLLRLVDELHRAYPLEHTISLSLASNVQHQQLVDVLAAFTGGITPAFVAAGWMPDVEIVANPEGDAKLDAALAAR
ncbi:MAG: hypothetical protein KC431_29160, partial [Myxococcales bacterium]|nr:hypothetical protein [Myxococcales bacterium]